LLGSWWLGRQFTPSPNSMKVRNGKVLVTYIGPRPNRLHRQASIKML
jgi:hypothetical protein